MHVLAIAVCYYDSTAGMPRTMLLDFVTVPSSAAEAHLTALLNSVLTDDTRWARLAALISDNTSAQDTLNRLMRAQQACFARAAAAGGGGSSSVQEPQPSTAGTVAAGGGSETALT